ncbi:MAG TPA: prolyl oligopeptidase family serine peptidase [Nocardioidaceae bacterium]|nr:prolyl oligopeptidase family serine peptidase [Nocardioidaceae bacterium]
MTSPPKATQLPHQHREHDVTRPDPFHWMRDLDSPELLAYLEAERSWYDAATGHLGSLVETIRSEMVQRVPATDSSVSWRHQAFSYYKVLPAGREYHQLLRNLDSQPDSEPHVLLDVNELAEDSDYAELGLEMVSPDERLLAYSVDLTGDEVYELRFRDLFTGTDLPDVIPRSYYGGAWCATSENFFYTVHDAAYRPFQIWRHRIGAPVQEDALVLEELDERFELNLRATRSGGLVVIWAESRTTNEAWVIDAHAPASPPTSVGGRRDGVEYHAEHAIFPDGGEALLVVTNDAATEFRLMHCPVPRDSDQTHEAWHELRPENPEERLERVDAFGSHAVLSFRSATEHRLRVLPIGAIESEGMVVFPAFQCGTVVLGRNEMFAVNSVTVEDQSFVTPPIWSALDLRSGHRIERHRQSAPHHLSHEYVCESRTVVSADGEEVPVTLVRHEGTPLDGTAPALLYAYGAYESTDEPEWDPALPGLLDRGVVFVHAHVRGGGERGRRWWNDGHLEHKQNTFTDLIAVADGLDGVVDGSRLATRGLSAGGLLQGAVFSQRPDRWRAVVAEVPFVDVVSTLFDPSIPLTVTEWDEWGDPRKKEEFDWLLAYSPYDNLPAAGTRPDLLVTGALHDPRVKVFEPAKWVAALRATDPDWSPRCLFRCETGAGAHVGPSGRFAHLGYEAEIYAWVLDKLGVTTDSGVSSD